MGKNKTEQLFSQVANSAGFQVEDPRPIRINHPVKNRLGLSSKIVTVPDFYVINPETQIGTHVEVTNGSGNNPHKAAQMRVVEAAGIDNYVQLTGDQVLEASQQPTTEKTHSLLLQLLGLLLTI